MKATFLSIAVAAQLVVVGAFAQTSGTTTGTADMGPASASYGSDWSSTLGPAMFGDDGMTLRPDSEIATQWGTLSEEDKAMLRRDCTALLQKSGGTTGLTEGTGTTSPDTGTTSGTATGAADSTTGASPGTTSGMASTGTGAPISVTDEQMEKICAATKDL